MPNFSGVGLVSVLNLISFYCGGFLKNALLINSLYYPNVGGVENSLRSINKTLIDSGWSVDILVSDNDQSSEKPLESFTKENFETVYRYQYKSSLGPFGQVMRAKSRIKEISPEGGYELVIARCHVTVLAAWLAGVKKVKYVVPAVYAYQNEHIFKKSTFARKVNFISHSIMQRLAFLMADRNFVFSLEMKRQIEVFSKGKVTAELVYPGVDKFRFENASGYDRAALREKMGFSKNDIILLCLGRFNKVKGFEYAIESLEFLDQNYKLIIVGEGGEEGSYHAIVNKKKLKDRVFIYGKTTKPELFYWASDVFLLPSLHEPFGQVLLEATASGLPIAAFDRSSGVDTATDEIYEKYPHLVKFSSVLSGQGLSLAIAEAHHAKNFFNVDFENSKKSFLIKYSWKMMVENVYGNEV